MSIPAGKRKPGQLIARTKTKAYVDYTTQTLTQEKNVPKRYRWVISGRILKCSQDMYIDICRANRVVVTDLNTFAYRATLQSMALDNAEVLFALMDLAEQHFHLDSNKVLHWTNLLKDAEETTMNWQRRDIERYNEQLHTSYTDKELNSIGMTLKGYFIDR